MRRKTTQQIFEELDIQEPDSPALPKRKGEEFEITPWKHKHSKSLDQSLNQSRIQSKKFINQHLGIAAASEIQLNRSRVISTHYLTTNNFNFNNSRSEKISTTTSRRPSQSIQRLQRPASKYQISPQLVDFNKRVMPTIPQLNDLKRDAHKSSNLLSFLYRRRQYLENNLPDKTRISIRGRNFKVKKNLRIPVQIELNF